MPAIDQEEATKDSAVMRREDLEEVIVIADFYSWVLLKFSVATVTCFASVRANILQSILHVDMCFVLRLEKFVTFSQVR